MGGILLLAGCAPTPPGPSPEPSVVFMTDDEAFAAAEATYRAYVDALNQVDLSDPDTFEAVYAWTTGEANANARAYLSQLHAASASVTGRSDIERFTGTRRAGQLIVALACLNVETVELWDATGSSLVEPSRPATQAFAVEFELGSSQGLQITRFDGTDPQLCT